MRNFRDYKVLFLIVASLSASPAWARPKPSPPRAPKSSAAVSIANEIGKLEKKVSDLENEIRQPAPAETSPLATGTPEVTTEVESVTEEKPLAEAAKQAEAAARLRLLKAGKNVVEVVDTRSYVEFYDLDPLPTNIVRWSKHSGKFLYISVNDAPFMFLFGQLAEGYEISINNRWVPTKNGKFQFKVSLPLEPSTFTLKLFKPDRTFQTYRLAYAWLKFPPSLRYRVKEAERVFEKAWGYAGRFSRSGWVQLYSDAQPVPVVDIDSQKNAKLYFRIYDPPEPEAVYDSWQFTVRDINNQVVSEVKQLGSPPSWIDWKQVASSVTHAQTYFYQIDLFREGQIFKGKPNRFDTTEGQSLIPHAYYPDFQFEPKEELGYYSFQSDRTAYSNLYVGADLPFVFWNRLVVRGTGQLSLHTLDENSVLSFIRLGAGMRFAGRGTNSPLGKEYLYRVDVLLNYSNFTISPFANIVRFTHPSLLIESHLVLFSYHYLVPWIEYGARLNRTEERLSFGLSYNYFIRPWSIKFGTGFSVDKLLTFSGDSASRFTILRTMVNMSYAF